MDTLGWLEPWRGKRVLVTGGSGFIGRHAVAMGVRAGVEILSQSASGRSTAQDVQLLESDLRDRENFASAVQRFQPDGVIHLAAAGVTSGSATLTHLLDVNVLGLVNLLDAVTALGTRPPVVVAGSGFEYEARDRPVLESDRLAPSTTYGVSKAAASGVAAFYGRTLPVTVLRLFSVYGAGEREPRLAPSIIAAARRGDPIDLTGCEQIRDFTYVSDAAEAFWRSLVQPPAAGGVRVLNMGCGIAVTLKEFVTELGKALAELGLDADLRVGAKPYRVGEPMSYVADVREAHRVLGWIPRTDISVGLRRMTEAML